MFMDNFLKKLCKVKGAVLVLPLLLGGLLFQPGLAHSADTDIDLITNISSDKSVVNAKDISVPL